MTKSRERTFIVLRACEGHVDVQCRIHNVENVHGRSYTFQLIQCHVAFGHICLETWKIHSGIGLAQILRTAGYACLRSVYNPRAGPARGLHSMGRASRAPREFLVFRMKISTGCTRARLQTTHWGCPAVISGLPPQFIVCKTALKVEDKMNFQNSSIGP